MAVWSRHSAAAGRHISIGREATGQPELVDIRDQSRKMCLAWELKPEIGLKVAGERGGIYPEGAVPCATWQPPPDVQK